MIGLLLLTTILVVLIGNSIMTPVYEAFTTLHMKEPMPSLLGGNFIGPGISDFSSIKEISTQIEILKSRSMLEDIVVKHGLIERYEIEKELSEEQKLQAALVRLRKDITISNITNTLIIKISIRSEDPELAKEIANSISQAFIERDLQSKRSEANAVLDFVSEQVEQVSERLQKAEEELLRYKEEEGIGVLDEEAKLKVSLVAQLEALFQQAKVEREVLGTRIAVVRSQMGPGASDDDTLANVSSNAAVVKMQDQLTEEQMALARLESDSSSNEQRKAEIKDRIDLLKKQIQEEISKNVQSVRLTAVDSAMQMQLAEYESRVVILAAEESALKNLIDAHEKDINKLPARETDLIRLERARRINDELYAALMRAKNEAQIDAASQIGNIDIVDPAVTLLQPVRPKKRENLIIGFVISLVMGISLAFILEYLDHTVKTEDEVKKLLGIPILGLIPRFETNGTGRRKKQKNQSKNPLMLVTRDDPNSPVSEAFKLLRANLCFINLDRNLKTIVVASPIPGDGKTTIAANLSIAFAAQEEKTLIVDADFRVPAIHKIFDLPDAPGIAEVLSKGRDFKSAIQKIEGVENLDILTTGSVPHISTELLGSSRMKSFINELKDRYDRIIFDVAPLLVATETIDLASSQDGTLLVMRAGQTDRRALKRVRDLFHNGKIELLGGVLNRVDSRDRKYGYGYYYYDAAKKPQSTGI
jgi:capsular exopolysaccharide synthesis family protein